MNLLSALMLSTPTCLASASPSHSDVATGLPGCEMKNGCEEEILQKTELLCVILS